MAQKPDLLQSAILTLPNVVAGLVAGANTGLLTITIPGKTDEQFTVMNIFAYGTQEGRIWINYRDKSYAYTHAPIGVHWRTFQQGFNPMPIEIALQCGSIIEIIFWNDGAAPGNYSVAFCGLFEKQ
jgi:hypothetical protein